MMSILPPGKDTALGRLTRHILNPQGLFVVFEGADGVGKSTIMEGLVPLFEDLSGGGEALIFHWKPTKRSIRVASMPAGEAHNPRAMSPRSMPVSAVFLLYHWLGFWAGYLRFTRPARTANRAVLGDRYAYEFMLDPERLRFHLPAWLRKLAARTVPQPDLVICLIADPERIMARKQELTEAEIRKYQAALTAFAAQTHHAVVICADGDITGVLDHTCREVREFFNAKCR